MNWIKNNILPILLTSFLLIAVFKMMDYKRESSRLHTELIGTTEKIVFLNENVANLERKYVTQKHLKDLTYAVFTQHIVTQNKRIKVLSNATFLIREKARKSGKSDIVYKGKRLKYIVNEIRYNNGPPVGYVLIFDDGRVVSKLYNHEISVDTLVARDEATGKYDVITKADYVLKSPAILNGWLNKKYPLKLKGGTAHIDPTEPINLKKSLYWWAPHLNANLNFYTNGVLPGLGISLAGYGYTKNDLDYKFLQLGVQYDNATRNAGVTIMPVLWRPFPKYLHNTYIGIGRYQDITGSGYFTGLQVGF